MRKRKFTFLQHVEELRKRLIKSFVLLIIVCFVTFKLTPFILPFLIRPIGEVVFISPAEAFLSHITVAVFGGLFLSSPFILYQVWSFVSSGLRKKERRRAFAFGLLSFMLFICGCLFGYFIILPVGLQFLLAFSADYMRPMIAISRYLYFAGSLSLIFGLVLQLPLVLLFLTKIGLVSPYELTEKRKEAIVLIFILAAFFTPPDVITQLLLALPLLVLYEIGILCSKVAFKETTLS